MAKVKASNPATPVAATPAPVAPATAAITGVGNPGSIPALAASGKKVDVKGGLASKLAALNKGAPAPAKKGGTPSVTLDVTVERMVGGKPTRLDAIPLCLDAMKREKDAGREKDDLYGPIAEAAEAERVRLSRAGGEVESSIRLNNRLTYVQPGRYSGISMSDDPKDVAKVTALQTIFGEQLFEGYFKPGNEVKVKADSLDDALLEDLMTLCAKHKKDFTGPNGLFEVKQVLVPTTQLTIDRVLRPEVESLFKQAVEAGAIRPVKASLKEAGS